MRNLRHLIRRSGLLSTEKRRRRPEKTRRSNVTQRRLSSEVLEKRELLAGDILASNHNYWNRYDVNDDGQISARDALGVINYMSQSAEAEQALQADLDGPQMFYDVNADNNITAADALGVINAMSRGEEVGELVELLLTARDLNDQELPADGNGDINLEVGQIFDLEVAYDDLRLFNDRLGVFQLFTDITVSQSGVLSPILNETQRLIIDETITSVGSTSVNFSIPELPPDVVNGSLTYSSPINDFGNDSIGEVSRALEAFGYTTSQFDLSSLDFGNNDLGFQIHWVGNEFGNVNLPNITVDVVESNPADTITTDSVEFAPFLADGVTPNTDAVRFNINSFSRTFNDNEKFYSAQNRGALEPRDVDGNLSGPITGFSGVGGLGMVPLEGGGIPQLTDDGRFIEPFDAFSLRVFLNQPVTDLVIGVNPGEDDEATLLYGRDDAVPQDMVLIQPENATITINAAPVVGNQDPVVSGPISQTFTEDDAQATISLLLGASDPDGDTLSISTPTISGNQAGIAVSGTTLTVSPGAYSSLNDGQSETITLSYNVLDGNGGSVAQTATIEVTGITDVANQNPVVSGPIDRTFTEDDAQATVSLLTNASDPDGDTLSISTPTISGNQAGIAVSGTTLTVTPTAYGALNTGQTEVITLNYNVLDGNGGSVAHSATVRITGITDVVNQNPVVSGPIDRTFTEDDAQATVSLLTNASDPDGDTLSISTPTISGNQAGIAVSGTTLTVTPTAYGALNTGQTEVITLNYNVLDGNGGSVAHSATVRITGITDVVNQNPVVSGPIDRTFTEDDAQATVSLLTNASDPDGDTLSISTPTISGNQAGIAVSGTTLTVTPTAYSALNTGQTEVITLNYNVLDGNGGSVAHSATVRITGITDVVNQNPVVSGPIDRTFTEDDAQSTISLLTNASDPDGDTLSISTPTISGNQAGISVSGSTLTVTPSAYGALNDGQNETITLSYNVLDGNGGSVAQTATINITGITDPFAPSTVSGWIFIDNDENPDPWVVERNGEKESDERGLGGVDVHLVVAATGQTVATAITDADGYYEFNNVAPGEFTVGHHIPDAAIISVSPTELPVSIPGAGGVTRSPLNFPILETRGSAPNSLDILASSYRGDHGFEVGEKGREGGIAKLDAEGNHEFIVLGSGFDGITAAELVLNAEHDAALLTVIKDNGEVLSALLDNDHIQVSRDGMGVQFLGGLNDFDFFAPSGSLTDEFDNFRNLIDQVMDGM